MFLASQAVELQGTDQQIVGKCLLAVDLGSAAESAEVAVLELPEIVLGLCVDEAEDAGGIGRAIDVRDAIAIAVRVTVFAMAAARSIAGSTSAALIPSGLQRLRQVRRTKANTKVACRSERFRTGVFLAGRQMRNATLTLPGIYWLFRLHRESTLGGRSEIAHTRAWIAKKLRRTDTEVSLNSR